MLIWIRSLPNMKVGQNFKGAIQDARGRIQHPNSQKRTPLLESPFSQLECSALRQDREKSLDPYQVENSSPPQQASRWEGTTSISNVPFDLNSGSLEVVAGLTKLQSRQEATNGSPKPLEVDSVNRLNRAKISQSDQSREEPKMIKKARIWKRRATSVSLTDNNNKDNQGGLKRKRELLSSQSESKKKRKSSVPTNLSDVFGISAEFAL